MMNRTAKFFFQLRLNLNLPSDFNKRKYTIKFTFWKKIASHPLTSIFCVTSNGNKLEIVTNQVNLDTNLDLSMAYCIKTNVTGS